MRKIPSIVPWAGVLVTALLLEVAAGLGAEDRDCNQNGVADAVDIASGTSRDCDLDGVPDECLPLAFDFKLRQTLRAGIRSQRIGPLVAEDLDGDGWVDFATTRDTRHVSILWGEGGRRFSPSQEIPVPFRFVWDTESLIAVDLESDGDLDLAVLRPTNFLGWPEQSAVCEDLAILRNEKPGVFRLDRLEELSEAPRDLAAGDFDADGSQDLLVAEGGSWDTERQDWVFSSKVFVLWNDGTATFRDRATVDVV